MSTYTIKVNEKTNIGKSVLTFLRAIKEVEVEETTVEESPYNPEFVAKIKNAMKGEGRVIKASEIWESI